MTLNDLRQILNKQACMLGVPTTGACLTPCGKITDKSHERTYHPPTPLAG